jgi:hypothetical protein
MRSGFLQEWSEIFKFYSDSSMGWPRRKQHSLVLTQIGLPPSHNTPRCRTLFSRTQILRLSSEMSHPKPLDKLSWSRHFKPFIKPKGQLHDLNSILLNCTVSQLAPGHQSCFFKLSFNPLTLESNPSAQRCLTRFLLGILLLEPAFR